MKNKNQLLVALVGLLVIGGAVALATFTGNNGKNLSGNLSAISIAPNNNHNSSSNNPLYQGTFTDKVDIMNRNGKNQIYLQINLPANSKPEHAYMYLNNKLVSKANAIQKNELTSTWLEDGENDKFVISHQGGVSVGYTISFYTLNNALPKKSYFRVGGEGGSTWKIRLCNASETSCGESTSTPTATDIALD